MTNTTSRTTTKTSVALALALALTLLATPTHALQVGPAATLFLLAPGAEEHYTLHIINDEAATIDVTITTSGPLDTTVTPATFAMNATDHERLVTVTLHEPANETTLAPGDTRETIAVNAAPSPTGNQFGSQVQLVHTLTLRRLYTGAYVDGTLSTTPTDGGAVFTLSLTNKGAAAAMVAGEATISSPQAQTGTVDDTIARVPLGTLPLAGGADSKLQQTWTPDTTIGPGRYIVNATINYDDPGHGPQSRTFTSAFRLGTPSATLELPVPALRRGEVARVPFAVRLTWNEPLAAVAEISLEDAAGNAIASAPTPELTLAPGAQPLVGYLDVPASALPGVDAYALRVVLRETDGALLADSHVVATISATTTGEQPVPAGGRGASSVLVVLALLLLLCLLLIAAYFWWVRRRPPVVGPRHVVEETR